MPIDIFPQEFIDQYGLANKVHYGFVYCAIVHCMCGLPQSGILISKLLRERLLKNGYYKIPHTTKLWKHVSRPISFTLVVDDFGIKYVGEEHAKHLIWVLEENYTMDVDWTGGLYCGIKLEWNYKKKILDISMPSYVKNKLTEYEHIKPKRPQHCPHSPNPIQYSKANQYPLPEDTSNLLDKDEKKCVQHVIGSFLFYAQAIDMTILLALNAIAGAHAASPKKYSKESINSLPTWPPTQMQSYDYGPQTWYSMSTLMHPTSLPQKPAAELVAISSLAAFQNMANQFNLTAPSMSITQFSNSWLHPQQKQN